MPHCASVHMLPWVHPCPNPKLQLDQFSCFCTAHNRELLYFTVGRVFAPLNIIPSNVDIWIPSNTWFLGPTRVLNPNSIAIGSAVSAGLTIVTDRQTDRPTDHATWSVMIGCIYVHSTAMWPNNKTSEERHWTKLLSVHLPVCPSFCLSVPCPQLKSGAF